MLSVKKFMVAFMSLVIIVVEILLANWTKHCPMFVVVPCAVAFRNAFNSPSRQGVTQGRNSGKEGYINETNQEGRRELVIKPSIRPYKGRAARWHTWPDTRNDITRGVLPLWMVLCQLNPEIF